MKQKLGYVVNSQINELPIALNLATNGTKTWIRVPLPCLITPDVALMMISPRGICGSSPGDGSVLRFPNDEA
jgi:hypothetical protein